MLWVAFALCVRDEVECPGLGLDLANAGLVGNVKPVTITPMIPKAASLFTFPRFLPFALDVRFPRVEPRPAGPVSEMSG